MIEQIVILDFGSQYTQVIARRVRECNVYSVILPFDTPAKEITALDPSGIILSGGPSSVYAKDAPLPDKAVFGLGLPRWLIGALAKRRSAKFSSHFADAIDIIVRGIKSGLPLHDCLKIIARESPAFCHAIMSGTKSA